MKYIKTAACLLSIGYVFCVSVAAAEESPVACSADCVAGAVRLRVSTLQDAFNRGDLAVVMSIYHPSMVQVAGEKYIDYATHMRDLQAYLSTTDRPRLRLEVNSVRALDGDYALANGRYHMVSKDGRDETALFSTIYMRTDSGWKIIYTHTS